jgi:c(7)-type cytochrome triheme protein
MRRTTMVVWCLAVLALVATAGVVAAQDRLPKLPAPYAMKQTGDSPGTVTFNHASHVDPAAPSCTSCHPALFKILKPGTTNDAKAVTHDAMTKGAACGSCHGRKAFGFDDCTLCHRSQ